METRKRCNRSMPLQQEEYVTKQELAERKSFPLCPRLMPKLIRRKIAQNTLFPSLPKPVFYKRPVMLSRSYNADKELSYFDQIFSSHDKIGEGSFGEVFKTRSRDDNKTYAVKIMKSTHNMKYAYAEVQNYEKIGDHLNFVQFFMAWEEAQVIHIQMEYCQLSLAQYAIKSHKICENQLWEILSDILKALDFLHKKKLIHLDVKPGNIMMTKNSYKLGDFGLLVDLNEHDGQKISTISDGDAKYLACEVLDGVYTYSCDIFGLGISLLELATNIELPEYGPLWHQIRKENLPTSFYNGVSYDFTIIIEKMMSFIHWQRPAAAKILKFPSLKKIHVNDLAFPRTNYCAILSDDNDNNEFNLENNNNNLMDTPRRPLHEVCSSVSNEDYRKITSTQRIESETLNISRKGVSRTKLAF